MFLAGMIVFIFGLMIFAFAVVIYSIVWKLWKERSWHPLNRRPPAQVKSYSAEGEAHRGGLPADTEFLTGIESTDLGSFSRNPEGRFSLYLPGRPIPRFPV
jgi:hypothetical protein